MPREPKDVLDEVEDTVLETPAPSMPGMTTRSPTFPCPYCGKLNDLSVEPDTGRVPLEFAEECSTCGREFAVTVTYEGAGQPRIHAERLE